MIKRFFQILAGATILSACTGPSNSPFTSASAPESGKIPVRVVASANATGDTATNGTGYNAGVQVVFGKAVPADKRAELLKRLGVKP